MASTDDPKPSSRVESVRSVAAQALEATAEQAAATQRRASSLADELFHAAGRVREALEELRPSTAEDVKALRERLDALEARVAARESAPPRPPATRSRAAAKPAATKEPSAAKRAAAGKRPAATRHAASRKPPPS